MTENNNAHDELDTSAVMEDFAFGGIEANEGRLLNKLRHQDSGLRHRHDLEPRDPKANEAVTLTVYAGPTITADRMTAYVTIDGTSPSGARGVTNNGSTIELTLVDTAWSTVLWDYIGIWRGTIPAQPHGTFVQYMIEGWCSYDPAYSDWSSEVHIDGTAESATRYGYTVDALEPPDWARDAVVYQVFVDRFSGTIDRWLAPQELTEFMGGTIRGVTERLDYLVDLGISVIWLSPIFTAVSYHAYDTIDYFAIDPRFGTEADLRELVVAAHERGLRLILDFVANHTGMTFPPFIEAQAGNAQYRRWFNFGDEYTHGYRTFFDVAEMPQLDTDQPEVCQYLSSAAVHWLTEFDVDGFRLDYAAGPSNVFWSEFQLACKAAKSDCWLFGEATVAGDDMRNYVGRLDGCLDFSFSRAIRQLCATETPLISLGTFLNHLRHGHRFFGETFLMPAFVDNHDMNRFLWVARNDKARLRLALGLLFTLGGPPILYYGTEIGLGQPRAKGPWREESRHPMRWDEAQQDQVLLAECKTWIAQRSAHPALTRGELEIVWLNEEAYCGLVARTFGDDHLLVAINVANIPQMIPLPAGRYHHEDQVVEQEIELIACSVVLLIPEYTSK